MQLVHIIVLACAFHRVTQVLCKPTSVNAKYTFHKFNDVSDPDSGSTTSIQVKDIASLYKRTVVGLYSRQLGTVIEDGIPRTFYETKSCGSDQDPKSFGSKIIAAWDEAKKLALAQTTARLDYDFGKVHTQWLGKDWDGWGYFYDYKRIIADNLNNLRKVFSTNSFPSHEYIYWYCYDYANKCDPGTVAYSWSSFYIGWRNHYTAFCPIFESIWTLDDAIRNAESSYHRQRIMENFETNRGQVMLHEVYHYTVVSNPRTGDYAYRADASWNISRDGGTWWAFENADSYALDAVAIYVQQHFSQSEPPIPQRYYKDTAEARNIDLPPAPENPGASRQLVFADTPPGWSGAQVVELNPDPSFWTEAVREGLPPLGQGLDIAAEVFGPTGSPPGPLSTLKATTVPAPPLLATKTTELHPPVATVPLKPIPEPICATFGVPFPQPPVEGYIDGLCHAKPFYHSLIVPPISFGTGTADDGRGKVLGVTDVYNLPNTGDKLYIGVMFDKTGCIGHSEFGRGQNDDESFNQCKARFSTALNGCQTDTRTAKLGGVVKEGCLEYIITARKGTDPAPFDVNEWWKGQGEFKCKETDVSTLGGDSSILKGTCTCWFDGYEATTDTFKMPPSGSCNDANSAELFTNN
ncbi:hypothetical protein BKA64DRAFT_160898 [Cadophora sp. MPI-SDFR-AT-0126]|nr:hypothetical protein BKA64DRAFT_160898 [Leotiomycetes sp. MPI-SDFR-AT-0126]